MNKKWFALALGIVLAASPVEGYAAQTQTAGVQTGRQASAAQTAKTEFCVELNGKDSGVDLISRSVARGNSHQAYHSVIIGNAPCTGHSECDAIISENGKVDAAPELHAHDTDAALIHEAAIGKIAGEQILKLRTLGMTEEEAEATIIDGFLS